MSRAFTAVLVLSALVPVARADEPGDAEEAKPELRTRSFPHAPETERDPSDASCKICHSAIPETGAPPEESNLNMGPEKACSMCHQGTVHVGGGDHLGVAVPPEVASALPPEVALLPDGTIACYTCHDVHDTEPDPDVVEAALEARDRPLAAEIRQLALQEEWEPLAAEGVTFPGHHDPRVPVLLSQPAFDGSLCRSCHGDGPEY